MLKGQPMFKQKNNNTEYIVNDQNHVVKGIDRGDTAAFLGIRYARGERFKKPVLEPLAAEVTATKYGDGCPQLRQFFDESKSKSKTDMLYYTEFRKGLSFTYSEDCLNLNIFVPKNAENLPVLLYIHGGAFVICSSDERPFDGKEIANEGVICVTANYRLNVFGYNADEGAQNLAFYDMICAIEWVKQNISAFGGDPSRITLMGQSAGAISIQNLVLLPKVKEMVQGSIMLSGGGSVRGIFAPKSLKRAKRFFARVRKDLQARGLDPTTCNAQDLYLAWYRQNKKNLALSMLSTMPVFDDEIVRKDLYENAYKDEQLPCILGVTKNDLLAPYLERIAKTMMKNGNGKVWLSHFYHPLPGDDKGAWHSSDLWYVFGLDQHPWRKFGEDDYRLATELRKRYCEFVKNGAPNPDGYDEWKSNTSKEFY